MRTYRHTLWAVRKTRYLYFAQLLFGTQYVVYLCMAFCLFFIILIIMFIIMCIFSLMNHIIIFFFLYVMAESWQTTDPSILEGAHPDLGGLLGPRSPKRGGEGGMGGGEGGERRREGRGVEWRRGGERVIYHLQID
jgi:hypothetical protein